MSDGEFNPNSYDAVLASINTQLKSMNSTLEKMQTNEIENNKTIQEKIEKVEKQIDTKIDNFNTNLTKSITEVNNKVIALEYFRYYLAGLVTAASAVGGAVFSFIANKWFGGGGGPTPPHA
tara:strand:- start:4945 stop:5307 length:363 start_codon:yes stop_codon:yes gene_type:complete